MADIHEEPHASLREAEECEKRRQDEGASLEEKLAEARMWARHGYEIGQEHCCWTDYGTAPAWLTEGWPVSRFATCENTAVCSACERPLRGEGPGMHLACEPEAGK
jgi:hypothetical protein